jgi:hypothetical protein
MTEERLKEIFESDDTVSWEGDNALLGLNIIAKYFPNKTVLQAAEHDVIYSVYTHEIVEACITEEDAIKLRSLNWMIDEDVDSLACFV